MCSAPNVYMFVYILIGTHLVPLTFISCNIFYFALHTSTRKLDIYIYIEYFL